MLKPVNAGIGHPAGEPDDLGDFPSQIVVCGKPPQRCLPVGSQMPGCAPQQGAREQLVDVDLSQGPRSTLADRDAQGEEQPFRPRPGV